MKKERRRGLTMKQAQRKCRQLRADGQSKKADAIEALWCNHPDYQSDLGYIMEMQSGEGIRDAFRKRHKM